MYRIRRSTVTDGFPGIHLATQDGSEMLYQEMNRCDQYISENGQVKEMNLK